MIKQVKGQAVDIALVNRMLHRICRCCKQKGLHVLKPGLTPNTFVAYGPLFKNSNVRVACMSANVAWEQRVLGDIKARMA